MSVLTELPSYGRLPLDVVGALGSELILRDGSRVLDLYGGHCVGLFGAADGGIGAALLRQWRDLSFVTNLIDCPQREWFRKAFEANLPPGNWTYFLSNSGAEANENALKLALGASGRSKVIAFEGAFHGRTSAASAVSDASDRGFPKSPFDVEFLPFGSKEALGSALDSTVAAVIVEPIQSLAGVVDPPEGFLAELRTRCDGHGAALIFDEVQTGNGRLGTAPWAAQHFDVRPDLFTTAKGIGGGFPLGITVASESWADRVDPKLFGSTFGGAPMALAAATEVARRISDANTLDHVKKVSEALTTAALAGPVARVRGTGLLLGLELEPPLTAREARDHLLDHGIFAGLSNDPQVLRLSPPLNLPLDAATRLEDAMKTLQPKVQGQPS